MNIQGKIHLIGQTESVGNNGFTKRQIVIATNEQYIQYIPIDFVKDKCSILDNYKVGQDVTVDVNVRGSEYNGKYYCNLQGWKITAQANAQATSQPKVVGQPFETVSELNEPNNDLPF